jgi:hypothetical protein
MSERSEPRLVLRGGWFAPLCRVLAVTGSFAVVGPPVDAAVYAAGYFCLQWVLGREQGILDETVLSFIQAIYTFATGPAAVIGAAIGLWREWCGSAPWLLVLGVAMAVGVANIGNVLRSDPAEPHDVSLATILILHAVTWRTAALLCWAMIARIGPRWLPAGKSAPG